MAAGGLTLLSVALALLLSWRWPFDGLYGQDAFAYARYAEALWPHWTRGAPLPRYDWPAGYPLLVAALLPLLGPAAGQAVSVLSAAATAGLTYLLTRELLPDGAGGRVAALCAGLAALCSAALLRASLVVMADAAATACCALALYAAVRYATGRRVGWLLLAALALGYAAITRWVCGLLLPVVFTASFLSTSPQRNEETQDTKAELIESDVLAARSTLTQPFTWANLKPHLRWQNLLALGVLALIVGPQLWVSQRNPAALAQNPVALGWSAAHAWQRTISTPDGLLRYDLPVGAFYLLQLWRLAPLAPLGIIALLWRPPPTALPRRAVLALLLGWPVLLGAFLSGLPFQNARYVLPALPALAALGGVGLGWLWDAARRTSPQRPEDAKDARQTRHLSRSTEPVLAEPIEASGHGGRAIARPALLGLTALTLLGTLALGARDLERLVASKDADLALAAWVVPQLPADATLITFGPTLLLQRYTALDVRELSYLSAADVAALTEQPRTYLLLNVPNIETQWAGLRQEQHLRQLRPALRALGERGGYTLFALEAKP